MAETFARFTPDGSQELMGPEGPQVIWRPCPADEALSLADDAVDELLDEWPEGSIALLTVGKRHNLQTELVEGEAGWKGYWDDFFLEQSTFYGHVLGFKGLERDAVVLCLNGFKSPERAQELLYVGLSRARQKLIVVGEAAGGGGAVIAVFSVIWAIWVLGHRREKKSQGCGRPSRGADVGTGLLIGHELAQHHRVPGGDPLPHGHLGSPAAVAYWVGVGMGLEGGP